VCSVGCMVAAVVLRTLWPLQAVDAHYAVCVLLLMGENIYTNVNDNLCFATSNTRAVTRCGWCQLVWRLLTWAIFKTPTTPVRKLTLKPLSQCCAGDTNTATRINTINTKLLHKEADSNTQLLLLDSALVTCSLQKKKKKSVCAVASWAPVVECD
jgi:hypothetical protein